MVGHGGSSAGSYLANLTSPIPSHCASIVVTSTLRVNTDSRACTIMKLIMVVWSMNLYKSCVNWAISNEGASNIYHVHYYSDGLIIDIGHVIPLFFEISWKIHDKKARGGEGRGKETSNWETTQYCSVKTLLQWFFSHRIFIIHHSNVKLSVDSGWITPWYVEKFMCNHGNCEKHDFFFAENLPKLSNFELLMIHCNLKIWHEATLWDRLTLYLCLFWCMI